MKCPAFSRILVTLVMPCGAAACVGVAAGGDAKLVTGQRYWYNGGKEEKLKMKGVSTVASSLCC